MKWTTPADLRAQVKRFWDKGTLLACLAGAEPLFPRRLTLKGPTSSELSSNFAQVRNWIARLDQGAECYRLVWRSINHRILGANSIPTEVWIDSIDDALRFIGRRSDAERFAALVALTGNRRSLLTAWLQKRPLRALAMADDWPRLLDVVDWLQRHPRPGIYLRQVDIPGVHSKFLERYRSVLAELFDLVLPPKAIDFTESGVTGFCRRYGFRDKPLRLRFRILDPRLAVFASGTDQDITVNQDTFSKLDLPVDRVFITENEINFLSFPAAERSMVVFGAGYGFDVLARATWLRERRIDYWGDIDTHGFAILDQLRDYIPHARSFLMDRETLLAHRLYWGEEPQPETRDLARLSREEKDVYDDLRTHRLAKRLRLEQERIGFEWLSKNM